MCGGVAIGPVRVRGYELDRPLPTRIPAMQIDAEVDRFRGAVARSRDEVEQLRQRLEGTIGTMESRILGVHLEYLQDAGFMTDVENRIRGDQLQLEDALAGAVRDFDRIFELVESERMKERALDLRDVALRVIRNLDGPEQAESARAPDEPHVLAAHKLSIADLFDLDRRRVLGIVAEEGGLNSHAGIVARSMGIPTISGVTDLRDHFRDGDFLILDAGTGVVYVNPDERLRREYEVKVGEARVESPFEETGDAVLADGTRIQLLGACGNLGEVTQAVDAGLDGVGVYRTELLFLVDRTGPGEDLLLHHYTEVLSRAGEGRVRFRLLDLSRDQRIAGLRATREPNPALGLRGVRLLLAERSLLRLQLRALLRLVPEGRIDVLVPFATTVQDIQRVQETVRAERASLLKAGIACADGVRLGAVVEVPATAFHIASIATEVDFLVVALDDLQQYLLAADRDNLHVADYYRSFHPSLFRLLRSLAADAEQADTDIVLFGEGASDPLRIPFYVGAGYRSFAVSPVRSPVVRRALAEWNASEARSLADRVLAAETSLELQRTLLEAER